MEFLNISKTIIKKYIILIRDNKALPTSVKVYWLLVLIVNKYKALDIII